MDIYEQPKASIKRQTITDRTKPDISSGGQSVKNGKAGRTPVFFRGYSEHRRINKVHNYLTFHDRLTGLYTLSFYLEEIHRLDKERNYPIALILANVNGLKLTSEAFGDTAGDDQLRRISAVLKRECRGNDIIARISGDEFVIILPKTNPEQASTFAVRISEAMAYEKPDKGIMSLAIGFAVKQDASDSIRTVFRSAKDDMKRQKFADRDRINTRTIVMILNSLYEKDNRELNHSKRVGQLCEEIASAMNYDKEEVNQIRTAGILHDIGKIRIDADILKKPEELDDNEWREIMKHPETGYSILSCVDEFSEMAGFVLQHQERWDGKGYPKALKGEEISVQARIIGIAAAFDSMTSDKPYGKVINTDSAVEEIKEKSGTQFDPEIARVFVEKVLGREW